MLMFAPQTTLAFAPAPEDLDDIDFTVPVIVSKPRAPVDKQGETAESGGNVVS